jgi:hypothetical protein
MGRIVTKITDQHYQTDNVQKSLGVLDSKGDFSVTQHPGNLNRVLNLFSAEPWMELPPACVLYVARLAS